LIRAILADVILVAHFALAAFISLGLVLIWLGIASSWQWIRQRGFRLLHLSAIVFVALEAAAGVVCTLTVWEDALRQSSGEQPGFIARWVQRLLYYEFPGGCSRLRTSPRDWRRLHGLCAKAWWLGQHIVILRAQATRNPLP
jgi:hypothetical protein